MKKIITSILFSLFFSFLFSQEEWNMLTQIPFPNVEANNVLVHNDHILLCGSGFEDTLNWRQGVVIAKYDTLGQLLHSNIVLDSTHKLAITEEWGDVVEGHGGGYVITAATVRRESAFLIKFDSELNIEFAKEYPDTINLSNFDYTPMKVKGGYLLFGRIMNPDFELKAFIKYVDFYGELIWEKFFLEDDQTDIQGLTKVNDSTFVTAVLHIDNQFGYHHSLVKFDLNQNFETKWENWKNTDLTFIRKIISSPDSGIIVHCNWETGLFMSTILYRPYLIKFNSNFEKEWEKFLSFESSFDGIDRYYDLSISNNDKTIIGTGGGSVPFSWDQISTGWISKYSIETGDEIWSIKPYPNFPKSFFSYGRLIGAGQLSSGNIIAAGFASENNLVGWLLKVTPDGCVDTMYCSTSPTLEVNNREIKVSVFPNPTADDIFIKGENLRNAKITLTDLTGRILIQEKLNEKQKFSLPETVQGMFFLKVETEEGIAVKRVLKF